MRETIFEFQLGNRLQRGLTWEETKKKKQKELRDDVSDRILEDDL